MRGRVVNVVNTMSKTNCPWGTERSNLIGVSAICYAAPAVVDVMNGRGRAVVWLLQALACFWSDFVDSGRYGISHCFDKILASTLTLYIIRMALVHRGPMFVISLAMPTFGCYGLSTAARRANNYDRYALFHSLWHVCGGVVAVLTLNSER